MSDYPKGMRPRFTEGVARIYTPRYCDNKACKTKLSIYNMGTVCKPCEAKYCMKTSQIRTYTSSHMNNISINEDFPECRLSYLLDPLAMTCEMPTNKRANNARTK